MLRGIDPGISCYVMGVFKQSVHSWVFIQLLDPYIIKDEKCGIGKAKHWIGS